VAALGQISALNKLGLLSRIKYTGGISGGYEVLLKRVDDLFRSV
jgi:hypothetical protein